MSGHNCTGAGCVTCLSRENEKLKEALRLLEKLTPGGSEYVGEPLRCYETVKYISEMQLKVIIRYKTQVDALKDLLELVNSQYTLCDDDVPEKPSIIYGHPDGAAWGRIVLAARKAKYTLEGRI